MARDRKRAKQRQRQRQQGPGSRPQTAQRVAPERNAPANDPVDDLAIEGGTPAPDPLAHASAEVDLARAAETGAVPPEPMSEEPLQPDELPQPDELEPGEADPETLPAVADGRSGRRGGQAPAVRTETAPAPRGNRFVNFLKASWRELQRVQWPDRRQVAQATGVVLGFVIVAGAYLGLLDAVWSRVMDRIL